MRAAWALLLAGLLAGCTVQSNMGLPGSYTLPMPVRCSLWIFTEESHVQEWALALACPGIDLIRLFPWPPVQPWDESPSWDLEPESTPTPTPAAPPLPWTYCPPNSARHHAGGLRWAAL